MRLKNSEKKPLNGTSRNATKFLVRLVLSLLIVGSVFYIIGPSYVRGFLPIFSRQIQYMHPEFKTIEYDVIKLRGIDYIQFTIEVNKPSPPGYQSPDENGNVTRHKGQANALVIAPIIIFSLILAWPSLTIRRRLMAFVFSIPLIILIQCMDYPMIFISNIETVFSPDSPFIIIRKIWSHVLNNGGRQFLAVIGFFLLIAPYYLKSQTLPSVETGNAINPVSKNVPCPCGSGKKYKNCCFKNGKEMKRNLPPHLKSE